MLCLYDTLLCGYITWTPRAWTYIQFAGIYDFALVYSGGVELKCSCLCTSRLQPHFWEMRSYDHYRVFWVSLCTFLQSSEVELKCHPIMEASMFLSSAAGCPDLERFKELRSQVDLLCGSKSTVFTSNQATQVSRHGSVTVVYLCFCQIGCSPELRPFRFLVIQLVCLRVKRSAVFCIQLRVSKPVPQYCISHHYAS